MVERRVFIVFHEVASSLTMSVARKCWFNPDWLNQNISEYASWIKRVPKVGEFQGNNLLGTLVFTHECVLVNEMQDEATCSQLCDAAATWKLRQP